MIIDYWVRFMVHACVLGLIVFSLIIRIRDARDSEAEAWEEVQVLRATLARYVDIDAISDPTHNPHNPPTN